MKSAGHFSRKNIHMKMLERFKEILNRDEFIDIREAGFVYDELHIHNMMTDLIID
jgi:hypothetical protein